MNNDEKDDLVDDAVYAVIDTFKLQGVEIPDRERDDLNNYLTALLNRLVPS